VQRTKKHINWMHQESIMASKTVADATRSGFFDMTKAFADFKVPGLDLEAVAASQRKNVEALTQANQLAMQGVQVLLQRQTELVTTAIQEFSKMFTAFVQPSTSPGDKIAKQAEYSKVALEQGLSNARELTELVTKANTEAFNVINKRVTESLEEVRDFAKKRIAA
jgi:phasin family protein